MRSTSAPHFEKNIKEDLLCPISRMLSQHLAQIASYSQETEAARSERAALVVTRGRIRKLTREVVASSRLREQGEVIARRREALQQEYPGQKQSELDAYTRELEGMEQAFQVQLADFKQKINKANNAGEFDAIIEIVREQQTLKDQYEKSVAVRVERHEKEMNVKEGVYQTNDAELASSQKQIETAKSSKEWTLRTFAGRLERLNKLIDAQTDAVQKGYETCREVALTGVLNHFEQRGVFFASKQTRPTATLRGARVVRSNSVESTADVEPQTVQAFLTAVYRGELDTVEELLKKTPTLVHADGHLTDLSKRTFTRITGFQYAVWALDAPMWDVILKYLSHADAKAQMEAYRERADLIKLHKLQYSFDNLLKQYSIFIESYQRWPLEQLSEHWVKKIVPEQALMPSWMIYAFTQPGENVAWVKLEVERGYLRVLSKEFRDFQRVIESGKGFLRYTCHGAVVAWWGPDVKRSEGWRMWHDRDMMTNFKAKSRAQHQELVNNLTKVATTPAQQTSHGSRPLASPGV